MPLSHFQKAQRARTIHMHISMSMRRNTVIPRNKPVVASISAMAALCRDENASGYELRSHLSMTAMMMHAGMNDSIERAYMQCPPKRILQSIISQK